MSASDADSQAARPGPFDLSPDHAARATSAEPTPTPDDEATTAPGSGDAAGSGRPLKQHGDALISGTGSRQGTPEPALDSAPHE